MGPLPEEAVDTGKPRTYQEAPLFSLVQSGVQYLGAFHNSAESISLEQKSVPKLPPRRPQKFSQRERLEVDLRRELQQARISGRRDDPKGCWGINVVGWVVELCVVPDVEHFQPQFNVLRPICR